MKAIGCKAALSCKGPLRFPDSEDVDTRGTESNIEDTNTRAGEVTMTATEDVAAGVTATIAEANEVAAIAAEAGEVAAAVAIADAKKAKHKAEVAAELKERDDIRLGTPEFRKRILSEMKDSEGGFSGLDAKTGEDLKFNESVRQKKNLVIM